VFFVKKAGPFFVAENLRRFFSLRFFHFFPAKNKMFAVRKDYMTTFCDAEAKARLTDVLQNAPPAHRIMVQPDVGASLSSLQTLIGPSGSANDEVINAYAAALDRAKTRNCFFFSTALFSLLAEEGMEAALESARRATIDVVHKEHEMFFMPVFVRGQWGLYTMDKCLGEVTIDAFMADTHGEETYARVEEFARAFFKCPVERGDNVKLRALQWRLHFDDRNGGVFVCMMMAWAALRIPISRPFLHTWARRARDMRLKVARDILATVEERLLP
jgi:hypothetical protein